MEAKELRIGNWINVTFSHIVKQQVVDCMCDSVNTKCHESLPFDLIEPIPLTEEWLLKFGFEKDANETVCEHWHFGENPFTHDYMIQLKNTGQGYFFQNWHHRIKYVHQLQNLYFALTGEELQIKE